MASSLFHTPTVGIGRLLNEGSRFVVPPHQRDYRWTEDEIEELLSDIGQAQMAESSVVGPETAPAESLTIEHILPRNPGPACCAFSEE